VIEFDEGDYVFDISGTDLGNHTAVVNFSGENEKLFYVDKTKPSIEENFATFTNEATNNSFNTDKTAVIKITEHNFDPQLAGLKVFRKDPGEEHNEEGFVDITSEILSTSRWVSEGDVHTISFTLAEMLSTRLKLIPKIWPETVLSQDVRLSLKLTKHHRLLRQGTVFWPMKMILRL